jgi:chloramphenicol-sensitive protein RarD
VVAVALGYFIYPLCTVLLGMILLGERLDRWAWTAIGLVFVGVLTKAAMIHGVPWISLMLAGSFSVYAVLRKRMGQDPTQGLFVETIILAPLVIAFFGWMLAKDIPLFFGGGAGNVFLAITAGVITVVPLILFHAGNRDLSMTMASLIFYSNPTMQLLLGVLLFGELFLLRDLWAFGFIWAGIAVYFSTRQRVGRVPSPHV